MLIMEMVLCSLALIRKTHRMECQQFLTLITYRLGPFVSLNIPSTKADTREPGIHSAAEGPLISPRVDGSELPHPHPLKWEWPVGGSGLLI